MENLTNNSNGGQSSTIIQLPPWTDYSFRIIFLTVHLAYFLVVAVFRDLQKLSLIHVHHTNLIGLLTGVHYCIWIAWSRPATGDSVVDNILCHISEAFWALSKVARCYSILVLAIYRLIAVYRIQLFKRIVKSTSAYFISILMVWLFPALIFVLSKFSSRSQPGLIMCYDGYSTSIQDSILYYVLSSFLGYVVPALLIVVIYILVRMKLNKVGNRLASATTHAKGSQSNVFFSESDISLPKLYSTTGNTMSVTVYKRQKEKSLAKQFIVINFFEMASCVFFVLLSSSNVITVFSTKYYFARQIFRIGNLISQTCIPIVSLIYTPVSRKTINFIMSLLQD